MNILTRTVDVLVIGGGTAGPMAAVKAKEANPKLEVLLLEKANVKRSGAISMGMDGLNNAVVPGFATPEQYVKEITTANDGIVNQKTVMAYARNSYSMPASAAPALAVLQEPRAAQDSADAIALRREAIGVLGYLKHAPALPALASLAASDPVDEVRRAAVGALAFAAGDADARVALETALRDASWQVREEAATALGKLQQPAATAALLVAPDDPDPEVRKSARLAIAQIGKAAHGA